MINLKTREGRVDLEVVKILSDSSQNDMNSAGSFICKGTQCIAVVHNTSESYLPQPIARIEDGKYVLVSDDYLDGTISEKEYEAMLARSLPEVIWETEWALEFDSDPYYELKAGEDEPPEGLGQKLESLGFSYIGDDVTSLIQQACEGGMACVMTEITTFVFCENLAVRAGDVPIEEIRKLMPLATPEEKNKVLLEHLPAISHQWATLFD